VIAIHILRKSKSTEEEEEEEARRAQVSEKAKPG
jgi:hypothetical protein